MSWTNTLAYFGGGKNEKILMKKYIGGIPEIDVNVSINMSEKEFSKTNKKFKKEEFFKILLNSAKWGSLTLGTMPGSITPLNIIGYIVTFFSGE